MTWAECTFKEGLPSSLLDQDGCGAAFQILLGGTPFLPATGQANTYAAGHQWKSAATALTSGQFVIVWEGWGDQDGDGAGIFAQRFDLNGKRLGVSAPGM